jgi:hypothetical protein
MKPSDYSARLEALAELHGLDPLHVLEWFLERAAIRSHDAGLPRAEAERLAMGDVEAGL